MPVYDRTSIPASVGRGTLDPELEAWLPNGPTLGADVSIAQGRRDHTILGKGPGPRSVASRLSSCWARTDLWQFASTRRLWDFPNTSP
jgi:hypothetical protein